MTIDANLLEGLRLGICVGFFLGIVLMLVVIWALAYAYRIDDEGG